MARRVDPAALERGLERIFIPPRELGDVLLDAAAARLLLRCDEDGIAALRAAGLPVFGAVGESFRRCDVLNVGLYSGSGRTIPEIAEAHRVRFAAEPRERWTEPRAWDIAFDLSCPREDCGEGSWELLRPCPERFGGAVVDWPQTPIRSGQPLRLGARVVVNGAGGTVASAAASLLFSELVDDLVQQRLRYQYLPPGLRRDPETAAANGVLDCVAASLLLQSRCREHGIEARTRRGLLLGAAVVEHVWLESPGVDQGWVPLDPVLAALVAGAGAGDGFVEFACGSISNRLLPWDLDAGEDLLSHVCGDRIERRGADQLLVTISAQPLRA